MNAFPFMGAVTSVFRLRFVVCLVCALCSIPAHAQDQAPEAADGKPKRLFASNDTLTLSITAPWRDIIRKPKVQDPYPATLKYTDEQGQTVSLPLTVERRGRSRQVVCEYPPIKLVFDKEAVKDSLFEGQKSLKLVTHCDKGERWEQYYIKEMLAYRMYNLITEKSFRVRPLAMTYVEAKSGYGQDPEFAFLIEDDKDVAKRNGLKKINVYKFQPEQLDPVHTSRFMLFELLIGGVDWSVLGVPVGSDKCCHNAKPIALDLESPVYSLPYDFDSSGLVDAHYAMPHDSLPISQVTQRLYRGFCIHNDAVEPVRQEFLAQEQAIYAVVDGESRLNGRSSKTMNRYLGDFFRLLRDDQKFAQEVIGKCRK